MRAPSQGLEVSGGIVSHHEGQYVCLQRSEVGIVEGIDRGALVLFGILAFVFDRAAVHDHPYYLATLTAQVPAMTLPSGRRWCDVAR